MLELTADSSLAYPSAYKRSSLGVLQELQIQIDLLLIIKTNSVASLFIHLTE